MTKWAILLKRSGVRSIAQCHDKMGNTAEALRCTQELLKAYPDYEYIKRDYLPDLIRRTR